MTKILSKKEVNNIINNIIYEYYKKNPNDICIESLNMGFHNTNLPELKKEKLKEYFERIKGLQSDNSDMINTFDLIKIQYNSFLLGIIIGTNYNGLFAQVEGYNTVSCLYLLLTLLFKDEQDKDKLFTEYCAIFDCGAGICLHIINVVPILKKIFPFDYNFEFGCEYGCCKDKTKLLTSKDFKQSDYEKYLNEKKSNKKEDVSKLMFM